MREIKFRQKLKPAFALIHGEAFHYWGYIDGDFVSPMGKNQAEGEPQQYTGLKDKHGIEIYEGDIVSASHGGIRVVEWVYEDAGFICRHLPRLSYAEPFYLGEDCFEVIGDIHENP